MHGSTHRKMLGSTMTAIAARRTATTSASSSSTSTATTTTRFLVFRPHNLYAALLALATASSSSPLFPRVHSLASSASSTFVLRSSTSSKNVLFGATRCCLSRRNVHQLRGGSVLFQAKDRQRSFLSNTASSSSSSAVEEISSSTAKTGAQTTKTEPDVFGQVIGTAMTPSEKLKKLRERMKELDLDVYLVPSDDPHLSGAFFKLFL